MPIRGALRPLHVPDECPAAIDALIADCMAKDPSARPTADEVSLCFRSLYLGLRSDCRAEVPRPGGDYQQIVC